MALAITPKKTLEYLPLALYECVPLATAESGEGKSFCITAGLDENLVAQLKKFSLDLGDTELQKTSDHMRFGEGSYAEWYSGKDRTLFALVEKETKALAAIAWFGPKPLGRKSMKHLSQEERAEDERLMDSGDWHTIVYRSYPPFRGKGLMTPFLTYVMDIYMKHYPNAKLWAGIYAENEASKAFATRLGFKVLEEATHGDETIMIKK